MRKSALRCAVMIPLLILIVMIFDISQGDPDEHAVRALDRDPLMDYLLPRDMGTLCGKYFLLVGKDPNQHFSFPAAVHFIYRDGSELIDPQKLHGILDPGRSTPMARRNAEGEWVIQMNERDWIESQPCLGPHSAFSDVATFTSKGTEGHVGDLPF